MKSRWLRTLSLFGLVFISLCSIIHAEEIVYNVEFAQTDLAVSQREGFDYATLPDCIYTREPGKPELPIKVLHFAIPVDMEVSSVEITDDIRENIRENIISILLKNLYA